MSATKSIIPIDPPRRAPFAQSSVAVSCSKKKAEGEEGGQKQKINHRD